MKLDRSTKTARVLAEFSRGHALNRFEAERLGDHTLPQTVHNLETRFGVSFIHSNETIPGFNGSKTHCIRYRLPPEEMLRARKLLGIGGAP